MPFLDSPPARQAISKAAAAPKLTMIVGAGVSAEAGLPTWARLVSDLLEDALRQISGRSDKLVRDYVAEWISKSEGLPGAGSHVQSVLGKSFEKRVRYRLYRGSTDELRPGPTARQLARLVKLDPASCHLLTTNYDDLLTQALVDVGYRRSDVKRYVSKTAPRNPSSPVVRHLHGLLTPQAAAGELILSDADYFRMQSPTRWQERLARERLEQSLCIFVGSSLSDPNLLRYLYRSSPSKMNLALFARQGDDLSPEDSDEADGLDEESIAGAIELRADAGAARWRHGGIEPLYADFFYEVTQFVYEVCLARACDQAGVPYPTYSQRIRAWFSALQGNLLWTRPDAFAATQDSLQLTLRGVLDEVRDLMRDGGATPADGERMAMHLWVHNPNRNHLVLWGSSDRAWRDPGTLTPVPIASSSTWISVDAFRSGVPVSLGTEADVSSRWNHVLGVPIRLDAEPTDVAQGRDDLGLLPVGSLTLASSLPKPDSALSRMDRSLQLEIHQLLSNLGQSILSPQ